MSYLIDLLTFFMYCIQNNEGIETVKVYSVLVVLVFNFKKLFNFYMMVCLKVHAERLFDINVDLHEAPTFQICSPLEISNSRACIQLDC